VQSLTKFFGSILLISFSLTSASAADPAPVPEGVTIVTTNIDELYSDLKFVFDEANEPKAWETLQDFLDGYVVGMERAQPIYGQVRLRTEKNGKNKYHTIWQFPVPESSAKTFIKNIGLLDYTAKEIRGARGTYKVSGSYTGYLKFISEYACFAEDKDDLSDSLTTSSELSKLLGDSSDLVVEVSNTPTGLAGRREALETTYKEVVGGIAKRKNEDPDRFELRKLWTEQQMAEVNRFVAEAARIHINWATDTTAKTGQLKINLEALPDTPLAQSVADVGKNPSLFRHVPHAEKTACSLHVNFPLDELRQKNAQSMSAASKSLTQKEIQKNAELNDKEKQNATNVSEVVYDAIDQVVEQKILDCFLNVTKTEAGLSQAVGGIRLDGNLLRKSIESHKGELDIKFAAEKEGEVEIHILALQENWKTIRELFGNNAVIYLATSPDAFWYSIGEGGSGPIHEAIKQTKETGDKELPAVLVDAQLSKLAEVLDKVQSRLKEGDSEFRADLLKLMSSADDTLHLLIDRKETKVNLEMSIQQGVFKGAGKFVAKGVREYLD